MKKTLLVTLDYYPDIGGISNYWDRLGEHLPSDSWVVLAPKLPIGSQEKSATYRIYRRSFFSSLVLPHWIPLFFHIFSIVRKEKIEHIIVGQILPIGTVMMFLSRLFKLPYSVSTHGMDIALPLSCSRKTMLCKIILKNATHCIVNSAFTESIVQKYGKIDCNRIYPCPFIIPDRFNDLSTPSRFPKGKKVLLTVGRLMKRKGHEDVIRAMQEIRGSISDVIYVIVGDGPYRDVLEGLVRELQLSEVVLFIGKVSDDEVARWYACCTAFIMVSKELSRDVEGFGIVYLEANAFGKPVIAGRSGGVEEAVIDSQTGILVSPGNSRDISKALQKIMTDSRLADRLGAQGLARVQREFVWNEQAKKLKDLLY